MLIKKRNLLFFAFIAILFIGNSVGSKMKAQEAASYQNKVKSMLGNFNNVRFSSVAYYEINDKQVKALKEIIKKKLDMEEAPEEDSAAGLNQDVMTPERADSLVSEIRKLIASGMRTLPAVRKAFNGEVDGYEHLEDYYVKDNELRIAFQMAQGSKRVKTDIYRMFLMTMPNEDNNTKDDPNIIALVLCKQRIDKDEYETALIQYYNEAIGNSLSSDKNILTEPELMNMMIDDPNGGDPTSLYEKLVIAYRQGNCQLITSEVRGIGTELQFVKSYGKSTSIIANENDVKSEDVAKIIRISDGQPFDYTKQNELVVSPDYISYRKYNIEYYTDEEGNMHPYNAANSNLPSYGAEIKFGLDEINYPSFWSERMSLRAVWDNLKLGLILPTSGWSSLTKSLFNVDRRFTHAGLGVSGSFDFPIKIIPQSGIFNISGSYVFGDAKSASYKDRDKFYDEQGYKYEPENLFYNDYIVRFTGQAHYTFAFSIDESYLLRFGIGATVYGTETWHDFLEKNDLDEEIRVYKKSDNKTVGGISMKMDFMSKDIKTPYGASVQYFDESLYANAWLQIPIVQDTFFLRFDVRGFFAAFKDVLHPWEDKSVFMPSVRLIFNF